MHGNQLNTLPQSPLQCYGHNRENPGPPADSLSPTIFHEDWWLNAATDGEFDVCEVKTGGRTLGRLPFHLTQRWGIKLLRMPFLTYFLGPAIAEIAGTANNRFLKRLEITRELLRKLPPASWEYVKCHADVPDMIAFQECGFRTYVQFTHEIKPQSADLLWKNMRDKTRNVVRRAEETFSVDEWNDAEGFIQLYGHNLNSKGIANAIDARVSVNIIAAALERKRGRILAARDARNQVIAANFCAWDRNACFYLLSSRSNDSGNGAISLLLWEAIKESTRRGLAFDFAGLGGRGSILLYSGFGASVCPRFVGVRAGTFARMLNEVKLSFQPDNFFY
jgi:hypothetical protein